MTTRLEEYSDAARARQGLAPVSRTPKSKIVWAWPWFTAFTRNEEWVLIPMFPQGVVTTTGTTCASVDRISSSPGADHVDTDK